MKHITRPVFLAIALSFTLAPFSTQAERSDHFKGKPARTIEEAFDNFATYNKKLEKLLEGELTPQAMAEIHQLTYTLENALQKIDSEVAGLADTLEAVHLASEYNETAIAAEKGKAYLELAKQIVHD